MEITSPLSGVAVEPIKRKVSDSLERLLKAHEINAGIDDVELNQIASAAVQTPLFSEQDLYATAGNLTEELVKPAPNILRKIKQYKDNPQNLIPRLPNMTLLGRRCLANSGILGEEQLGRYSLSLVGRNSYRAAADIIYMLYDNESFVQLFEQGLRILDSEEPNDRESNLNYMRIFSNRFADYVTILKNADLMMLKARVEKDHDSDIYSISLGFDEEQEQDSLIEELGIPSRKAFFSLVDAAESLEGNLDYKAEVSLIAPWEPKLTTITIIPKLQLGIVPDEGIDNYLLAADIALKKAIFLINTFYEDNGIRINRGSQKKHHLFTKGMIDDLMQSLDGKIDEIYNEKILSHSSGWFWELANEDRIRSKLKHFDSLYEQILRYESKVPFRAAAISSKEHESFLYDSSDGHQVIDLMKYACLNIIKGIQTQLFYLPEPKKEYPNERLTKKIEESVEELRNYTSFISNMKQFFDGTEKDYLIGAGIRNLEEYLKKEDLPEKIVDDFYKITRKISGKTLILESMILGEELNPSKMYKLFSTGENVLFYFMVAGAIRNELVDQLNFNHIPKGKIAFTRQIQSKVDDLTIIDKTKDKQRYDEDELISGLTDLITEDSYFKGLLEEARDPVRNLAEKLSAFRWIPEALVFNLERSLKENLLGAVAYKPGKVEGNEVEISLTQRDDLEGMLNATVEVYNKVSPHKIHALDYAELNPKSDSANLAICKSALAVISTRYGSPKSIFDRFINENEDFLFQQAIDMFPEDDIYFGPILGVAVPFEFAKGMNLRERGSELFGAEPTTIQTYNDSFKNLEELVSAAQTRFHEITHASHSGFRHSWRRVMAVYSEIMLDFLLKKYEQNLADSIPFDSSNYVRINREIIGKDSDKRLSYKDIILSILDDISKVALGVGDKAENMRRDGFYEGTISMPYRIREGFYKARYHQIDDIGLEDSVIKSMVKETFDAVRSDDVRALESLKERFKDYSEGMTTIEETSAEVMSNLCMEYLMDELGRLHPEKENYYKDFSREVEEGFKAISEITLRSDEILNALKGRPSMIEKELNENGWTHSKVYDYYQTIPQLKKRLSSAGLPAFSMFTLYNNFSEVRSRLDGRDESEFYLPINEARNFINRRYRRFIPDALFLVRELGSAAWDTIFSCEDPSIAFLGVDERYLLKK